MLIADVNRWTRRASMLSILATVLMTAATPIAAGEICKADASRATLADPAAVPQRSPAAVKPNGSCSAWTHTLYFSDATHSTEVGSCSITCRQYDLGSANPTFEEGGTCSGTESAYTVDNFTACPCPF